MSKQYSDIRSKLKIEVTKTTDNNLAHLTHYFHNYRNGVSQYFKPTAEAYLTVLHEELNIAQEPDFQYYLPIEWDIPFPPSSKPKFKFIDLFAGIGGFRIALQNIEGKCVFSSEINSSARRTYELNFGECPFGDIKEFTNPNLSDEFIERTIPEHDVLSGGFPCQPFSLAGVSARNYLGIAHGFSDTNQGNLFFDIARIIRVKKPKVVFLENVKNFKNHDNGNTFQTVKNTMIDLGYDFHSSIINSNKVVAQNRQRFYMVCFLGGNSNFRFPEFTGEPKKLKDYLESTVRKEYTISDKLWMGHQRRTSANLARGTGFTAYTADLEKPANTIVARYGKDGKECLIPQPNNNPRKLTPRECARLQGFPENYILPSSNAAAYRQFGNSVAVPVIEAIAGQILNALKGQ